jgi:hypothetical protein
MLDVTQRLKIVHPLVEEFKIPEMRVGDLPKELAAVVENGPTWKVEWFYSGEYKSDMSLMYVERFRPNEMCSIMGRISDTVGFCNWEKAFALWEESLFRHGIRVFYEGRAFWQSGTSNPVVQKVTMISAVLDLDHVITVTNVKRLS